MTTDPHDEHGEILRRALNAEADTVTPAGDGLDRIRARIEQRGRRRFARYRLTPTWARPVLAAAAAVLIAGIGVSAPQTLNLIQQSVGSNDPSGGHEGGSSDGDHAGTRLGPDGQQIPVSPGTSGSESPSTSESPAPASPPGVALCPPSPGATPPGSPTSAATPAPSGSPAVSGPPCSTQSPPTSSSPPPTPTTPKPSDPGQPSEKPTQEPTSEPSPSDAGVASAP